MDADVSSGSVNDKHEHRLCLWLVVSLRGLNSLSDLNLSVLLRVVREMETRSRETFCSYQLFCYIRAVGADQQVAAYLGHLLCDYSDPTEAGSPPLKWCFLSLKRLCPQTALSAASLLCSRVWVQGASPSPEQPRGHIQSNQTASCSHTECQSSAVFVFTCFNFSQVIRLNVSPVLLQLTDIRWVTRAVFCSYSSDSARGVDFVWTDLRCRTRTQMSFLCAAVICSDICDKHDLQSHLPATPLSHLTDCRLFLPQPKTRIHTHTFCLWLVKITRSVSESLSDNVWAEGNAKNLD